MASTNKTPKLGLNQWAAGDSVLRTDFNADNAKIEAAMEVALAGSVLGDYIGDNTNHHEINVGFAPQMVMIYAMCKGSTGDTMVELYVVFQIGGIFLHAHGAAAITRNNIRLSANGFHLLESSGCNSPGWQYQYIAFR